MHIDFETRSACNIKLSGSWKYAHDQSTKVLCLAYGETTTDVELWHPGKPRPSRLFEAIALGEEIHAHNAGFEAAVWEALCVPMGWPAIHPDQWRCTASQCRRMTLPGSLAAAGEVLRLGIQKDDGGKKLIQQLCVPRADGTFNDDPALLEQLYAYCRQDVRAEIAISNKLPPLDDRELSIWRLDQIINNRGIQIDLDSARHAIAIVESLKSTYGAELAELTDFAVTAPTQLKRLQEWIFAECGIAVKSLDAAGIAKLMLMDLPPKVRMAIEIRQAAGKSSNAKLEAMLSRACDDGRVRDNIVYHGASTGRWAGSGLQIQNFPRPKLKDHEIEGVLDVLPTRDADGLGILYGSPLAAISSSLRAMIVAEPKHRLIIGDFNAIECRAVAWLARQEDLLGQFREKADPYKAMAAKIYDKPVEEINKDERFFGKSAVLGCGFGAAARKFRLMCQNAGQNPTMGLCRQVVKVYREANSKIVELWSLLGNASVETVRDGQPREVNDKISVSKSKGFFRIVLPSGRDLVYAQPILIQIVPKWNQGYTGTIVASEEDREKLDCMGVDLGPWEKGIFQKCGVSDLIVARQVAKLYRVDLKRKEPKMVDQIAFNVVHATTKQWTRETTYGSKLVENITQAVARDIMCDSMLRLEAVGYPITMTVHDEVVAECPEGFGSVEEFTQLMEQTERWCSGCPIAVEAHESKRYGK